jgi:hypothetical protein
MQEVAGERGGYLHGRGGIHASLIGRLMSTHRLTLLSIPLCSSALDSDDLLYLKEQMEAEEDAERLLRRTEKRAFAAFKISLLNTIAFVFLLYTSEYNMVQLIFLSMKFSIQVHLVGIVENK